MANGSGWWLLVAGSMWTRETGGDTKGRETGGPDLVDLIEVRETRVVLADAHLGHDPRNNRLSNLRALCQHCHLIHDRVWHALQRRLTWKSRYALGDLFEGPYRPGILGVVRVQATSGTVTDG